MLMRFDPFREIDQALRTWTPNMRMTTMPLDAYRHGDTVVVEMDLPGVDPDSIDLTVERNVLRVTARREPRFREDDQILVAERPSGEFSRELFLGDALATDRIDAHYDAGVLRVELPVADEAKPHRISIQRGNGKGHTVETQAVGTGS